jgi:cysteine desulfurase
VADFTTLLPECEAYTFSGHKFGALQGVGFSFIKKDYPVIALLSGSGPQSWIRPGTPNTLGILTLKPAMEELLERFNPSELIKAKEWFESQLVLKLGERGTVVGTKARQRNLNTIMMTLEGVSADVLQQALDHAGIAVSTGAACSSGLAQPSHVLRAMGQSENAALSGVRFSFSPYFTLTEAKESWPVVGAVLEKFI